jgi:poly(hydroxyalkanoate) depolymerase family esterase
LFDRTRVDSGDTYGDEADVSEADGAAPAVPDPRVARRGEAFIDGAHRHRGRSLRYKLYVPPVAGTVWPEAADRHPLVVMLHGCTQDPDDFARGTQMNRLAHDQGCYVLYPGQSRDANPSGCWNWFEPAHQRRGAGEPAAIVAVVEWVRQQYPIDPDRIYVAGLSAGGAMAAILGDAYPDVFAAVGVHSGLPPGAARNLPEALAAMKRGAAPTTNRKTDATRPPTIVFHGNRDRTVHPSNGDSLVSEVAEAAAEPLSRVTTTGAANGSRSFTRTLHCAPGGQPIAEHWTIHGGGHAWFGGSQSGRFADPRGPDASREMLRFFLEKRRRPT